jgi:vitellogenic carboxypeptidase-like protein
VSRIPLRTTRWCAPRRSAPFLLVAAAFFAGWAGSAAADDRVQLLPGYGEVATHQYAGYVSIADAPCLNVLCDGAGENGLFYWLVAKHADDTAAPTILWTNGGPGSTSFWGFFTENGPYSVNTDGTLADRPSGWNNTANYLIFDHPLGVGLSFAPEDALPANVQAGVDQWYRALVHLVERHPELAAEPLLLAGESYGGTYVPLLANAILDGNARAGREVVPLRGIILAAPWVDPVVGQSMDTTYAYTHGLISAADKAELDAVYAECEAAVEAEQPSTKAANEICGKLKSGIEARSGRYLLNIASTGDPPTDQVAAYLNRPDVRAAIHARPDGVFSFFSEPIGDRYEIGVQDSYRWAVQEALDRGVPVMVVSGLNDATDVNFLGVNAWLERLTGDRAAAYRAAPRSQWKDAGGAVLGYVQDGGGLTNVAILGAGHLAAADQPLLIDLIADRLLGGR